MKANVRTFFYHKRLNKEVTNAQNRFLRRGAAYIRKIARDFVKHRKNPNVHSEPYHSPYDHFGLRDSILFAVNGTYAVIGPRLIRGGLNNVARLHEFGGTAMIRDIDPELWNGVNIGDTAPVTSSHLKAKDIIVRRESKNDPKTGRPVAWIKIRSKSQARHSTRLYRRMGSIMAQKKAVRYLPRPYMKPALEKSIPYLSQLWKNAIK